MTELAEDKADPINLRGEHGSLSGRVRIDRIQPGCLQAHWPEANAIIPAGRLDPSGVPDYNAEVKILGARALAATVESGSMAAN